MRKFILGLAALLCVCCASPREYKEVKFEYYETVLINRTRDIFLSVICISKFPTKRGDKCLYNGTALFPRGYILANDPKLPYKKVLYLKPGKYVVFLMEKDLYTGKELEDTHVIFEVIDDGELVFNDKETRNGKTEL